MRSQRNKGFTLVEVIIIMAVLSILVALAAPGISNLMDRNSVATQANKLMSNILVARSEAIKREQSIVIGQVGSWKDRYRVFVDLNGDNSYDDTTEAPEITDTVTPDNTTTISGSGNFSTYIRFNARGRAVIPPSFTPVVPASDFFTVSKNGYTRYICFSATGRPRIQEAACS